MFLSLPYSFVTSLWHIRIHFILELFQKVLKVALFRILRGF